MTSAAFKPLAHWTNDRQFFFKYMSRATGKIVLENRTLRWSTPGTLNDPYDIQFDLHIDIDREAVKAATLQKMWDAHYGDQPAPVGNALGALIYLFRGIFPQLSREEFDREFGEAIEEGMAASERRLPWVQEQVRTFFADSKILCLSEVPDSTLMWSYYADQHQGVVLRFRCVPELDSPWGVARPIKYVADMPRLLDSEFLADLMSGRVSLDPPSIMDRLVFTKAADWAHEREWRIFSGAGRNPQALHEDIPFHALELDAVIVGCRMSDEDRAAFSDLTLRRYPHAQLLQAERAERQFQLNIRPLEISPHWPGKGGERCA